MIHTLEARGMGSIIDYYAGYTKYTYDRNASLRYVYPVTRHDCSLLLGIF